MRRDETIIGEVSFDIGKSTYYVGPIGNEGTLFLGGGTKRTLMACFHAPIGWTLLGVWIVGEGWGAIAEGHRSQCSEVAGWLMEAAEAKE